MNARALRTALLAGKRRPRRIGVGSPTQFRGDGYEFVELRDYLPGDDPRRIDWAATARSGELQTRVVLEDVALTLATVVDESASMRVGRNRMVVEAAREAASAWFECALSGDRCIDVREDGVLLTGATNVILGRTDTIGRAPAVDGANAFDFTKALSVARAALPRGAALLLITDAFDLGSEHDDLLASLAWWCDCTALIARDPWREGFPLRGFTRLRDAETGKTQVVFLSSRRAASVDRAVRVREAQIEQRFTAAGWRFGGLFESDGAASLYAAFGFATNVSEAQT
jgi:hypothetical protein